MVDATYNPAFEGQAVDLVWPHPKELIPRLRNPQFAGEVRYVRDYLVNGVKEMKREFGISFVKLIIINELIN